MKSFSKYVFAIILVLTLGIFSTSVFAASYPNYAESTEWRSQLGFTGYVQVVPASLRNCFINHIMPQSFNKKQSTI